MQTTLARAETCMLAAKQRQKHYYDRMHMPAEIAIGSDVLLATTNLHLKTVGTRKLIPRWVGPFQSDSSHWWLVIPSVNFQHVCTKTTMYFTSP